MASTVSERSKPQCTYAFDGGPISDVGKFVEIFKRQADGSWKIHVTIWNSDKPPPGQ